MLTGRGTLQKKKTRPHPVIVMHCYSFRFFLPQRAVPGLTAFPPRRAVMGIPTVSLSSYAFRNDDNLRPLEQWWKVQAHLGPCLNGRHSFTELPLSRLR